jgi:predicted O-methyltransferase YrrM
MTFEETWKEAEKITGYLFIEEGKALFESAIQIPEQGVIVELGSFCGKSTRILVEAAKERHGKVYCVDSFVPYFDCTPTPPEFALRSITEHILIPYYDFAELIKKDTSEAAKYFNLEVDLLFIDADHSFEGLAADCENWLPKLKSGGLAIFHDWHSEHVNVKKAGEGFVGGWHNVRNDYSVAVFRKP